MLVHPQHIVELAPVVTYLINDENDNVRKQVRENHENVGTAQCLHMAQNLLRPVNLW